MVKIKKWHESHEYLIWIVLGVIVLRIPSLFEPYWYGDEGIYLVLGKALREGLTWYSQIHDNKPPLLYLVAALAGNLMWFRLILMIWNAINIFIVGLLAEKILKQKWVAYLVAALFGILTSLPWLEGNIANGEVFMIMPVCLAVLMILNRPHPIPLLSKERGRYLLVGGLFALGFLFKVPVIFDVLGIGLWLLFFQEGKLFSKEGLKKGIWIAVGFTVPILLTVVYYFIKDAGINYITAAFLQNAAYLSSWSDKNNSGLVIRGIVALVATILIWFLTKREKSEKRLVFVWLIWALFGSLLSERPYPHYLIQIVAPAALLIGILLESKMKLTFVTGGILVVLVAVAIFRFKFYFFPTASYYQNFYKYVTKQTTLENYYLSFDSRVMQSYEVAKYLKARTEPKDRVFVWGDEPYIYALADRLPPGRFTVAYHIADFDGREETMEALRNDETKYIVVMQGEQRVFDDLFSLILAEYSKVGKIGSALIYRRVK